MRAVRSRAEDDIREAEIVALVSTANDHGLVGSDGIATIHAKMPTALQLFAEGRLSPVGGTTVEVMVGGKSLGAMMLLGVRCISNGGHHDVAELVFRPAIAGAAHAGPR